MSCFGDVIADKEEVRCFFLPIMALKKLSFYELNRLKQFCSTRIEVQKLIYTYSKKYNIPSEELANF